MAIDLLHVGFRNFIPAARVVAVMSPDSAPVRRLIQESKTKGNSIDLTKGRKTKAVMVMDSGHVVLVAVATDTIAARLAISQKRPRRASGRRQDSPE
ncbi:MAG: DUF370 domain-containing protein [Chloroflexi bacterium]|nr:DUF370 domain-containing protein [Chloroflexota bacterium]